jgi:hypothetical protein
VAKVESEIVITDTRPFAPSVDERLEYPSVVNTVRGACLGPSLTEEFSILDGDECTFVVTGFRFGAKRGDRGSPVTSHTEPPNPPSADAAEAVLEAAA